MKAELVLNDLSVIAADSDDIARDWFTETLSAVTELIYQDVCNPILHAEHDLYDILLTDDYGFSEWLEELEPQDDLRLLAMQLTTKTPTHSFLKNIKDGNDDFIRSEFYLKTQPEKRCNALGVALISDGISVSFPSQEQWCVSFIEIQQVLYNAEDLNPEQTVQHRVRSISKPEHVDNVVRNWRNAIGEKSHNVDELLNRWHSAFPYLDLCCEYKDKFLPNLNSKTFESVKRRLRELDNCCYVWTTEARKDISYSMRARPDSKTTMDKKERANMRLATCPNNGEQHFIMHCDIQPKGYRLYWFEDKQRKRLTICYAGSHLETVQHKAQ
jgi:hypothetical protein